TRTSLAEGSSSSPCRNQPRLLAVELRRTSRQGLCLQTIPAATPVSCQLSVDGRPASTKNTGDDRGTFAVSNTLHRAHAHRFQRLMIKLSRVVFGLMPGKN